MLSQWIGAGGLIWVIAQVFEFFAVAAESGSSGKGPEGEKLKHNIFVSLFLSVAALATPGLLYAHAYVEFFRANDDVSEASFALTAFVTTIGSLSVIFAVFGGVLLGAILGAAAKGLKPILQLAAAPLAAIALVLALAAAWPSLPLLIEQVTNRFG